MDALNGRRSTICLDGLPPSRACDMAASWGTLCRAACMEDGNLRVRHAGEAAGPPPPLPPDPRWPPHFGVIFGSAKFRGYFADRGLGAWSCSDCGGHSLGRACSLALLTTLIIHHLWLSPIPQNRESESCCCYIQVDWRGSTPHQRRGCGRRSLVWTGDIKEA